MHKKQQVSGKVTATDAKGYYRFANLPPDTYVVTATAFGFTTMRREGLLIEVATYRCSI